MKKLYTLITSVYNGTVLSTQDVASFASRKLAEETLQKIDAENEAHQDNYIPLTVHSEIKETMVYEDRSEVPILNTPIPVASDKPKSRALEAYPHLSVIEVSAGCHDEPNGVYDAIIGFVDMADAEKIASEYEGEIVELHLQDGWKYAECLGSSTAYEEYTLDRYKNSDRRCLKDLEDLDKFVIEELQDKISYAVLISCISEFLAPYDELRKVVLALKENESVVVNEADLSDYEVLPDKAMQYREGATLHAIGVAVHKQVLEGALKETKA